MSGRKFCKTLAQKDETFQTSGIHNCLFKQECSTLISRIFDSVNMIYQFCINEVWQRSRLKWQAVRSHDAPMFPLLSKVSSHSTELNSVRMKG